MFVIKISEREREGRERVDEPHQKLIKIQIECEKFMNLTQIRERDCLKIIPRRGGGGGGGKSINIALKREDEASFERILSF